MNNFSVHHIIPGILEKDWIEIEKKIETAKQFSNVLHVDFIDGKFVNNLTFLDATPFKKYSGDPPAGEAGLFLEAHLMVDEPLNYLKPLADAGFKRFLGHAEKMTDQEEFVAEGQILGEVGLALDLGSSLDLIKVPFEDLDCILLMSIKAGFSNQTFEQSSLEKIKDLRSKTDIPIEVDGGINDQTIIQAKEAGANRFVSNSFVFKSNNSSEQFKKLMGLV